MLAPKEKPLLSIDELISEELLKTETLLTFSELSISFLAQLSNKIFEVKHITNFPELVALAYWIRKTNIATIIKNFSKEINSSEIITPRGIAFHIAPSNVDSIFLYSWALSLIVGNINIVRISQNVGPQLALLLLFINDLMKEEQWSEIRKRNFIITYPHEDRINSILSSNCDIRILWGGDETIKKIRNFPSKATTKEIPFADKFSYTIIDSGKYLALNDYRKDQLAKQFYNDSYWFDQMACSSPRFVYFVGSKKKNKIASDTFWRQLEFELVNREKSDSMGIAMNKLVHLYETASSSNSMELSSGLSIVKPTVVRISKSNANEFRENCGGGFFYECFIDSIDHLVDLVKQNDQTLSYFGFSKNKLKNFIKKVNGKGIDRIVPIGQALNFSPTWDGYSLLHELTKKVNLI
jgi:hypothetical protein